MLAYIDKIKKISKELLESCQVEMIIGFRQGSLPMMNEPCFIKKPEDVETLVWNGNCGINLANYLTNRKEKIGIVAKGCDTRNIVTHIMENKIKRDQVVIIGVPCKGMINRRGIAVMAPGEVSDVVENSDQVIIKGSNFEKTVNRNDVLQDNCKTCTHRNPVIYDELVADLVEEQKDVNAYADVEKVEAMTVEDKQHYFSELLSTCVRCYACRNACPLCYCPTCFVDESQPQWVGKTLDSVDTLTFHFLRAFHCAGRCTDCGACERACPMGINVRAFTKKLNKDVLELYGWEAGLTLDQRPALDVFRLNDADDFIK